MLWKNFVGCIFAQTVDLLVLALTIYLYAAFRYSFLILHNSSVKYQEIPAGPASGVSFPCATKHLPTTRFRSFLYPLRGLHITGRSLTRSTFACQQQGVGVCRPASPKAPESESRTNRNATAMPRPVNHSLACWHLFVGRLFRCKKNYCTMAQISMPIELIAFYLCTKWIDGPVQSFFTEPSNLLRAFVPGRILKSSA